MAIILPQGHPAFSRLQSQNIPVRAEAANSDPASADKAVTMGFVNLMPREYLDETVDLLLGRLAHAPHDIRPVFISPEGKGDKGISWEEANQRYKLDSALITGYAASNLPFEELEFWPALQAIINDADRKRLPLVAVCAGAMAVAYQTYGIDKERAPHKLLGNYEYKTEDGRSLHLATSRNNTLNRRQLLNAVREQGLRIAAQTDETPQPEPGVITDHRRNWILTLAHLEYAYTTSDNYPDFEGQNLHILEYQYLRDHNTASPKYDPDLAARVLPPAHLELTAEQVRAREDYADRLLSGWVARTYAHKHDVRFAPAKHPQGQPAYRSAAPF